MLYIVETSYCLHQLYGSAKCNDYRWNANGNQPAVWSIQGFASGTIWLKALISWSAKANN